MAIEGIDSGLDTYSLIQDLMKVERMPLDRMELKQDIINKRKEIYGDVLGRLENLENRISSLCLSSSFDVFSVSYSQQSVLSLTTNTSASPTEYSITVNNIARAHTIGSDRVDDAEAALGLSEGTIYINGVGVSIDGDDSLSSIGDKINSTADIGVTATIVDNVLRLKMDQTGATEIEIVDSGGICVELGILDIEQNIKNQFVAAADASFSIDGQDITSSSNSISDIIEGVTINLIASGSTDVSVDRDIDSIISVIENFVNQYNSAVSFIYSNVSERKITSPQSDADRLVGTVSGDGTLNRIRFRLSSLVSGALNGAEQGFESLASIGISRSSFSSDESDNSGTIIGTLEIDETAVREALENDFESVKELFTKNYGVEDLSEGDYGIAVRMGSYLMSITNSTDGVIKNKNSSFDSEIKSIDRQIEAMEHRLELREESITKQFIAMETALDTMDTQSAWLEAQLNSL